MLPEQVWDEADIPAAFMYLGRCAGSATPLMCAHAEYIKLLRSTADGQVFDRIPVVAERYLNQRGRKDLEVWKPMRRVRKIPAGSVLRVMAPGSFLLRWSADGGGTSGETASTDSGLGLGFVDIQTQAGQTAPVQFAFARSDTLLPEVYDVEVTATQASLQSP
jgi:glucoamylase